MNDDVRQVFKLMETGDVAPNPRTQLPIEWLWGAQLPLPMSNNNRLKPVRMGKFMRLAKTGDASKNDNKLKLALLAARPPRLRGPIALKVLFYVESIASDSDNRVKALCDAMTGIAWTDDNAVTYTITRKLLAGEHGMPPCCVVSMGLDPSASAEISKRIMKSTKGKTKGTR